MKMALREGGHSYVINGFGSNMKKVIILTIAALLIIGTISGGTWAFFSDTETSQNNTITAGSLDLQVGVTDPCTESIDLGYQIQHGMSDNAADWTVTNLGSADGILSIDVSSIVNYENNRIEPEQAAGDTTTGVAEGELGDFVDMAIWLDIDQSGGWSSGDMYLGSDGSVVNWVSGSSLPAGAYDDVNNYAGIDWEPGDGMPTLPGSGDLDFMVESDFPNDVNDNRTQTDSCVFDINFTLEQV